MSTVERAAASGLVARAPPLVKPASAFVLSPLRGAAESLGLTGTAKHAEEHDNDSIFDFSYPDLELDGGLPFIGRRDSLEDKLQQQQHHNDLFLSSLSEGPGDGLQSLVNGQLRARSPLAPSTSASFAPGHFLSPPLLDGNVGTGLSPAESNGATSSCSGGSLSIASSSSGSSTTSSSPFGSLHPLPAQPHELGPAQMGKTMPSVLAAAPPKHQTQGQDVRSRSANHPFARHRPAPQTAKSSSTSRGMGGAEGRPGSVEDDALTFENGVYTGPYGTVRLATEQERRLLGGDMDMDERAAEEIASQERSTGSSESLVEAELMQHEPQDDEDDFEDEEDEDAEEDVIPEDDEEPQGKGKKGAAKGKGKGSAGAKKAGSGSAGSKPSSVKTEQDSATGRRKINISFIEDDARRHITFSKRKAGIMKKAYELATLTGTQVLLLVVSSTGLVFTFATPKLKSVVRDAEGRGLIQNCLNAPDQPDDLVGAASGGSASSESGSGASATGSGSAHSAAAQRVLSSQQPTPEDLVTSCRNPTIDSRRGAASRVRPAPESGLAKATRGGKRRRTATTPSAGAQSAPAGPPEEAAASHAARVAAATSLANQPMANHTRRASLQPLSAQQQHQQQQGIDPFAHPAAKYYAMMQQGIQEPNAYFNSPHQQQQQQHQAQEQARDAFAHDAHVRSVSALAPGQQPLRPLHGAIYSGMPHHAPHAQLDGMHCVQGEQYQHKQLLQSAVPWMPGFPFGE